MQKHLEKEKKKKSFTQLDIIAESCKKGKVRRLSEYLQITFIQLQSAPEQNLSEEHKHVHLTLAFHLAMLIHFICNGVLRWKHLALNSSP